MVNPIKIPLKLPEANSPWPLPPPSRWSMSCAQCRCRMAGSRSSPTKGQKTVHFFTTSWLFVQENHCKTMGKPWENHGKTGGSGRNHGVSAEKPLLFCSWKPRVFFRPVPMNTTDLPSAKSAMGMGSLKLILWLSDRIRKSLSIFRFDWRSTNQSLIHML